MPNLDGSREPVPTNPGLPDGDSSLISALDQLAELGAPGTSATGGNTSWQKQSDTTTPSDSVVIEAVGASEPIDPPEQSTQQPRKPAAARPKPVDPGVLAELAADEPTEPRTSGQRSRRFPPGVLFATVAFGATMFALGWFLRPVQSDNTPSSDTSAATDDRTEPANTNPKTTTPESGVYGRITYRRPESACLPDRGSRIVIWKVGYSPEELWSANGFRPGDSEQLTELASVFLREAGGAMAIADDDGFFSVELPSGGDYEILILSRFGGQGFDEDGLTAAETARLKPCFQEPHRVVGKTQFAIMRMHYKGEGAHLLDHVFEVIN